MTEPVAVELVSRLREQQLTLATAESLTGGLIGQLLTDVPGASVVYRGGVISYATDLKHTLAGVSEATLAELGPVADRTAREMAEGVAARCGAVIGLAVTGVAGPEPQGDHPVGQVFLAVADRAAASTQVVELRLAGDRRQIRTETALAALGLVAARLADRVP